MSALLLEVGNYLALAAVLVGIVFGLPLVLGAW